MTEDVKKAILALRDSISRGFGLVGGMKCSSIAILLKDLSEELEQVKRERDAAVKDLAVIKFCALCRNDDTNDDLPFACTWCGSSKQNWQWRGPCAENGGVEVARDIV